MALPGRLLGPGWATEYVDPPVPYVPGGRDRSGWDCWGLVRVVYAEQFGIELPSFAGEYGDPSEDAEAARAAEIVAAEKQATVWLPVEQLQPGDVLSIAMLGHECHVAVFVEGDSMLHTVEKYGTRIERIGPRWQRRIRGSFRHWQR